MHIQSLETRRLLSVSTVGNELRVYTSAADDAIAVIQNSNIQVTVNGATTNINPAGISLVRIYTFGGKDNVFVDSSVNVKCTINTGDQDDIVRVHGKKSDTIDGAAGIDTINYELSTAGVNVTLDGIANDGKSGETDNVLGTFEIVKGSNHNDMIGANFVALASVYGLGGIDTLTTGLAGDAYGGEGNDLFQATPTTGKNAYYGGNGIDTVSYLGRGTGVSLSLDATANDGVTNEKDYLHGDVENLTGTGFADTLRGNQADNILSGLGGSDYLYGGEGKNTLYGGSGNDRLFGGTKADVFSGSSGDDTVSYEGRTQNLKIRIGTEPLSQSLSGYLDEGDVINNDVENAIGGNGNDYIIGSSFANRISGGKGNDVIDGGLGADSMSGGEGSDTIYYSFRTNAVTININNLSDDGESGENDNIDSSFEKLVGGKGNDVINGGSSNETIFGNEGNDTINAGAGNDDIYGDAGADIMNGGSGSGDYVQYSNRGDSISASIDGVANDGAAGEKDNIGTDVENLWGGSGNDTLKGDADDNTLAGLEGDDVLIGSGGSDYLVGNEDTDTLDFSARTGPLNISLDNVDNDTDDGQDIRVYDVEKILGGSGNDTLTGSDNADSIIGGDGNDKIDGKGGNDTLKGGIGNDTITGGTGKDKIYGEAGNDKFYVKDGEVDTVDGGSNTDSVLEKDNSDVLSNI